MQREPRPLAHAGPPVSRMARRGHEPAGRHGPGGHQGQGERGAPGRGGVWPAALLIRWPRCGPAGPAHRRAREQQRQARRWDGPRPQVIGEHPGAQRRAAHRQRAQQEFAAAQGIEQQRRAEHEQARHHRARSPARRQPLCQAPHPQRRHPVAQPAQRPGHRPRHPPRVEEQQAAEGEHRQQQRPGRRPQRPQGKGQPAQDEQPTGQADARPAELRPPQRGRARRSGRCGGRRGQETRPVGRSGFQGIHFRKGRAGFARQLPAQGGDLGPHRLQLARQLRRAPRGRAGPHKSRGSQQRGQQHKQGHASAYSAPTRCLGNRERVQICRPGRAWRPQRTAQKPRHCCGASVLVSCCVLSYSVVPRMGFEPTHLAALVPETSASTNSATSASLCAAPAAGSGVRVGRVSEGSITLAATSEPVNRPVGTGAPGGWGTPRPGGGRGGLPVVSAAQAGGERTPPGTSRNYRARMALKSPLRPSG